MTLSKIRTIKQVYRTAGFLLLMLAGCSPNQNSFTSNIYHNLTAHYNGYYYAHEETRAVETTVIKSLDDDHNQLLQLFPKLDTNLAKTYSKETEEIIKMASISIQRHPNSRWVYRNYLLVGLARMYACDFQNAIQTFKYINTKSNDPDTRHEALIYLVRTFTEQAEYQKAEETIDFLSKEKLSVQNQKLFLLEQAYLAQIRKDYNSMVQSLAQADPLLNRSDRRGRIYFIIGQVYQKLGFGSEAFNYYKKCLSTNPEYEIDFYARLNMAQVTSIDDRNNSNDIRKELAKMLSDDKNKEFKDKIYFEMGEFELRQGNLPKAMDNYRLSLRAGTSQRIKGNGYLRLGQIYYDSLKKFPLAKDYYDSAVQILPSDSENLESIKKRQSILADFVEYTGTIHLQDSLLKLADLDTAVLRRQMDSTRQIAEKLASLKKPKKIRQVSSADTGGLTGTFYADANATTSDWYFGNLSAVSIGQTEFQRIWGALKLEDNWRRSVKTSVAPEEVSIVQGKSESVKSHDVQVSNPAPSADPFMDLFNQLPRTKEMKDSANAKIERAYLKLGDLYYFRLQEKENAIQAYQTLLLRFPQSRYKPETLYKLYLASKEINSKNFDDYKIVLIKDYPGSTFAKVLINPNYQAETTATADKQKALYKQAYQDFISGNYVASNRTINDALSLGETNFNAQIELLKVMITGKTEEITLYQYELGEFIKKYPNDVLKTYAEKLLDASKEVLSQLDKEKGIRFVRNLEAPHQIVMVHQRDNNLSTVLTEKIDAFNTKKYKDLKLTSSNLALDQNLTMTIILDFKSVSEAKNYLYELTNSFVLSGEMVNYKFDIFVITQENFGTLYRTKALPEYLAFYDRNY